MKQELESNKLKTRKNQKKYLLILGVISFLSFFSNLWTKGANLMESRNFITSREIIESGNWMVTTLNGEYRFEKPPIPSWLTASVMKLTNNSNEEWILRIPVALLAFIVVFYIFKFIKKITGNINLAFSSSLVFCTSFLVIKTAGENSWDFYPYAFIFMAITHLLEAFSNRGIRNYVIGGIFLGASILSKGPVGVYGMFIPFIIAYTIIYGFENFKKKKKGIFIFFIVGIFLASIWPIYMMIENRELFLSVVKKEGETWSNNHKKPFYFYLNFLYLNGVWTFFTIAWTLKFWSNKRTTDKKSFDFIYLWHIIAFIFLSAINMKKERYGLPLYFTSAMGVGSLLDYYSGKLWKELKKTDKVLIYIQSVFLFLLSLFIPILFFIKGYLKNIIKLNYLLFIILFFYIFNGVLINAIFKNKNYYIKKLIFFSGFLMVLITSTTIWFIETGIRNNYESKEKYLKNFKLEPRWKDYPIYSDHFDIWDVWNIGKKIKKINKKNFEEIDFPEIFIYLTLEQKSLELNFAELLKKYKVVDEKKYFRALDDKNIVRIYFIKKKN